MWCRSITVIVCSLALLTSCRDVGDDRSTKTTTTEAVNAATSSTVDTTSPTATTRPDEAGAVGIDPLDGASTATVSVPVPATSRETALLTAVRAARHEGYDRVVFEFGNVLPGYRIGYVERPVVADGSGDEVTVSGAHVIQARFENALDADLTQESAPRTYTGPGRFNPGTPQVSEIVRTGGFEGVLTWAIGLRDRVDFRVTTLTSPPRVVIDFANH